MDEITIRIAAPDDVAAMAELREASGWQGGAGAEIMRRYLAGEHHPQHAFTQRAMFVAESGGTIVGYIAGHLTTRLGCEGELQWLLVAPAHRGGLAAARLLVALARWFATVGVNRVCVNVAPENTQARRFYRRYGAEELSEYWMVWSDVVVAARVAEAMHRAPDI
ncbi:MAG: N-acetyltransferase family protein [Gemmatimonas sp.]|nr:GNAT family N-acetyltransferase [Gemmatimonadaceae bacterium]